MTHLSLSTKKTQTYSIKKKAVANHLRNQLKNIPEKHFDQELSLQKNCLHHLPGRRRKTTQSWVSWVVFSRLPARCLSEQLYSAECQAKAIETYKNNSDDLTLILEAAKIIRNQMLKHQNWKFHVSLSGFDLSVLLPSLLRWIITGRKHTVDTILKKTQSTIM